MRYTKEVIEYCSEEVSEDEYSNLLESIRNNDLFNLKSFVDGHFDFDREFKCMHEWLSDNCPQDAQPFFDEFNYGTEESLNSLQLKLVLAHSNLIYATVMLAYHFELH